MFSASRRGSSENSGPRRLRARCALHQGTRAVRPTDRLLRDGAAPAHEDARQRHPPRAPSAGSSTTPRRSAQQYGTTLPIKTYRAQVSGNLARDTYTYEVAETIRTVNRGPARHDIDLRMIAEPPRHGPGQAHARSHTSTGTRITAACCTAPRSRPGDARTVPRPLRRGHRCREPSSSGRRLIDRGAQCRPDPGNASSRSTARVDESGTTGGSGHRRSVVPQITWW
ncbi:MAG: hypothetical protein JWR90_1402 [Marmoricola sp.]|nr:hypothetical protein [Marmoricola sp.]